MSLRSFPPPPGTFTCDICGKPGVKQSRQQKRHTGACQEEARRRRDAAANRAYRSVHGIQARRARRNA